MGTRKSQTRGARSCSRMLLRAPRALHDSDSGIPDSFLASFVSRPCGVSPTPNCILLPRPAGKASPVRLCSPHAQPFSRLSQFSPKNCGGGSWRCPALRGERCPSDTAVTASGICLGGQGLLPEVTDVLCRGVTTQNPPGFTRDGLLVSADVGNAGAS